MCGGTHRLVAKVSDSVYAVRIQAAIGCLPKAQEVGQMAFGSARREARHNQLETQDFMLRRVGMDGFLRLALAMCFCMEPGVRFARWGGCAGAPGPNKPKNLVRGFSRVPWLPNGVSGNDTGAQVLLHNRVAQP